MARGGSTSAGVYIPGKFNGNIFKYNYDSAGLVIDVFVNSIAGLYIIEDKPDFGRGTLKFYPGVVEHIVRELHGEKYFKSGDVRVVFHLAQTILEDAKYQNIGDDFLQAVSILSPLMRQELKDANRENIRYGILGFICLALCMGTAQLLKGIFGREGMIEGISQGLSVIGWVIMWRPLDYFLFDRRSAVLSYRWTLKLLGSSVEAVVWDGNLNSCLQIEK